MERKGCVGYDRTVISSLQGSNRHWGLHVLHAFVLLKSLGLEAYSGQDRIRVEASN